MKVSANAVNVIVRQDLESSDSSVSLTNSNHSGWRRGDIEMPVALRIREELNDPAPHIAPELPPEIFEDDRCCNKEFRTKLLYGAGLSICLAGGFAGIPLALMMGAIAITIPAGAMIVGVSLLIAAKNS